MEVNRNDLARFNKAVEDLAVLTQRNTNNILIQATTRAARSAAKATKQAPKNRRKRDIRGRLLNDRKKGKVPWWADYRLQVWKQKPLGGSELRTLYVTEEKLQAFLPVPRRGIAKKAWLGAASRIRSMGGQLPPAARKYSFGMKKVRNGLVYGAVLENRVRYIQGAGPLSDRIGVTMATKWIEGYAIPRAEEKLRERWAREAARG